jgi:hypothetical protein
MYLERKSEKTMDEQQRNQSLAAHVISSIGCGHYEMPGPPNFGLQSNQSTEFRILNSLRKRAYNKVFQCSVLKKKILLFNFWFLQFQRINYLKFNISIHLNFFILFYD